MLNHAYVVRSIAEADGVCQVELYNPWGSGLTITLSNFQHSFSAISVSWG